MNYVFAALLLNSALTAEEPPPPKEQAVASVAGSKSLMVIDPKGRAEDFVEAFELLKREKPTLKIALLTSKGLPLSNVTDMNPSANGTLLQVKVLSNQGAKLLIIPIEDVMEISYSP